MLYVPGLLKCLDGRWLERSVRCIVERMKVEGRLDAVDAHFAYPDGVGCVRLAARLGVPVFITVRGVEVDQLARPCLRRQIVGALSAATGIVSVSHTLRDVLISAGVDGTRVRVIHNAIDRDLFRPGDRAAARHRLARNNGEQLIVAVGNLVELKRHDVLIEAVARVRTSRPGVRLAIIGAGDAEPRYGSGLRRKITELGVADAVELIGKVSPERVVDWLQAADVFALATAREGCCNAVLEALACGIPVVTTPAGDNAQFVRAGTNGYLVPIGDVAGFATAIDSALQHRDWDPKAIAASLTVGNWSAVGRKVLAFFEERLAA